jgi:pimeloyl-ACP methyl ester carboxylesterase
MAQAIERARQAVQLDRFVLVGHSYAGAVVAQYAAEHRDHVAGVVYLDAAAVALPLTAQQLEQLTAALRADKMAVVRGWFAPLLQPSSRSVRDAVFASVERSSTDAFIGALTSLTSWDPKARINAYTGPRLAVVAADVPNPLAFDTQFPEIRSVRISGAGHWLMLDKPDEVTAAIKAFVAGITVQVGRDGPCGGARRRRRGALRALAARRAGAGPARAQWRLDRRRRAVTYGIYWSEMVS